LTRDFAVAGERCQDTFVPHVLAPGLEFLWTFAELLAEAGQGRTEAVRICVWNTSPRKRFPEDGADGPSVAPMRPSQATCLKLPGLTKNDLGSREQRITRPPQLFRQKVVDPLHHDRTNILADRKEIGRESLAEFCFYLPSVLNKLSFTDVDVL